MSLYINLVVYYFNIIKDLDNDKEINSQQHIKQFVIKVKQYTARSNNFKQAVYVFDLTNVKKSKNITT